MAKYKNGTYHKGYFRGGSNDNLNFITCKDRLFIPSKLKSYVLYCYHTYLLYPGMDITKAMVFQNLYWPYIRDAVHKGLIKCDTFQCAKLLNKKYGKLPAKLAKEIPWYKLFVDLI